jgi:hypothetical protein
MKHENLINELQTQAERQSFNRITREIHNEVWDRVDCCISILTMDEVSEQIRERLENEVKKHVEDQLYERLEESL